MLWFKDVIRSYEKHSFISCANIQHFLFYDLQDLEEIDMSHNSLSFIHPHAFTELTKLVTLNLANNELNYFQDKWISRIMSESLNSIQLHDNNFQCDCQLKDDNMQKV